MGNEITNIGTGFDIAPSSLDEAWAVCERLAQSTLVPKDFQRNPGNIMVAAQMGAELGLKPLQAIQNIAVINGRPAVWGDALLAIVRGHPECEGVREYVEGEGDSMTAVCEVRRRGEEHPIRAEFSVADAKKASLWGKQGPWSQYPKRMLQLRARAFALRDGFADALRGIQVAEEVRDITPPREEPAPEQQRASATDSLLRRHGAQAAAQQQDVEDAEVVDPPDDKQAETDEFLAQIAAADSPQAVGAVTRQIKDAGLPDHQLDTLRKAVADRKAAIKAERDAEEAAEQPESRDESSEQDVTISDDPAKIEAEMIERLQDLDSAVGVHEIIGQASTVFGDGSEPWLRIEAEAKVALDRIRGG